jgi:hypothetical protein
MTVSVGSQSTAVSPLSPTILSVDTCLTGNTIKRWVYDRDVHFVAGFEQCRHRWVVQGQLKDHLWNLASLLIRPEAIVARGACRVLPILRQRGFTPIAVRSLWLNRAQAHALWEYQANLATQEHLRLLGDLCTAGPSIYVLLRDASRRVSAPATVHLTHLKGPTLIRKRQPGHLRSITGPKLANLISYLHIADDPADLIRDMALLFNPEQRATLLAETDAAEDRTDEVLHAIVRLEAAIPPALELEPGAGPCARAYRPIPGGLQGPSLRPLAQHGSDDLRQIELWHALVRRAQHCRSFATGETYNTKDAIVPDEKRLSLPLDSNLVVPDFSRA